MSLTMKTSEGDLKIELFTDIATKNTESFLALCGSGFYDGTIFHRVIAGFMVQGGDPTGTGKSIGESVWGGTLQGEVSPQLAHSSRGTVSMCASQGGNGSQFFISFAPTPHLDGESTVIGRVIGGEETLARLEAVPVGKKSRPLADVSIKAVVVHANPFA
jgi:peptidyl-prolyl cis-trans isomerase-like 3